MLRTQAQAEYAAENYGHFGLNLRRYAHFTSPIRRYADLIVHRGLIRALKLGAGRPARGCRRAGAGRDRRADFRDRAARHAGRTRNQRPADRAFPRRPHRRTFEGRISGVTRAGLFVKLHETGADGFVPARTIGDEYFRYDEAGHAMVGRAQRRDLPARRPRHRQAGGSGAGCRRAALRASVGRHAGGRRRVHSTHRGRSGIAQTAAATRGKNNGRHDDTTTRSSARLWPSG